jgi:hypothetical protein
MDSPFGMNKQGLQVSIAGGELESKTKPPGETRFMQADGYPSALLFLMFKNQLCNSFSRAFIRARTGTGIITVNNAGYNGIDGGVIRQFFQELKIFKILTGPAPEF